MGLPNSCVPCTTSPPEENPCGYGEYWSSSHCSTDGNNGCQRCRNDIGNSSRYLLPNPFWRLPDCPYTCGLGYYDIRENSLTASGTASTAGGTSLWPECVACPPPTAPECAPSEGLYFQCGVGMGYLGGDVFNAFAGSMGMADTNGDSRLSIGGEQSELAVFRRVYGSRRDFTTMDTNNDDEISPAEILSFTGTTSLMYTEL